MENQGRVTGMVVAMVLSLLLSGCGKRQDDAVAGKPEVTTMTVRTADLPVTMEYVAQTASSHKVNIQARVSGFLQKRLYQEGGMVKNGQVLFTIDPRPFQVQLDEARAALASSTAAHATAKANLDRIKPLVELNALSRKDLDNARGQFLTTQAAVHQARAQLDAAKLNLSYTTIRSPVDGMAGAAAVSEGSYVNAINSQLTTVYVMTPMWVNFSLSENRMLDLQKQVRDGQIKVPADGNFIVEAVLPDGTVFPHRGKIVFASPDYDATTGTNQFRASLDNPEGVLKPNQFVRVRLEGAFRPDAVAVPQKAVQQGAKGHFVWVVSDGKAQYRPVIVGEVSGTDWVIRQGLHDGEQVVVDGVQTLSNGVAVDVTANMPSPSGSSSVPESRDERSASDTATEDVSSGGTDKQIVPVPATRG